MKIGRAIISCHDKSGLSEFVTRLLNINPEMKIICSSGTYRALEKVAANNLVEVSEYTGFKEMPSGLVKTLHPKIHAGILADLNDEAQRKYLEDNGIESFDLIVANLYPFETAVKEEKGFMHVRNNIDIGGVSLLEAGSKNFLRVTVITNPEDYNKVADNMAENNGSVDLSTRLLLAKKAMAYLQHYLTEINNYFSRLKAGDLNE